jgi:hypothetical protein
MRRAIHPLLAAALGSSALLSGCVVIAAQSSQQLNTIGAVRLSTTICFSGQPGCPDKGNTKVDARGGGYQVLLGYRLPADTSLPQMFNSVAGQPMSFSRDNSYGAELERLMPAGQGQRWVGYRSGGFGAAPSSPSFTVDPAFALRQSDTGKPFEGPFSYRVVSGARSTPQGNPNAPVNCGFNPAGNPESATTCVDSPSLGDLGVSLQQPTQDVGIVYDPMARRAAKGNIEPVGFRVVYSGKGEAPTFSLKGSTNIPGASARVQPQSISPGDGSGRATVKVRMPQNTPNGSYDVTLVASLPNGQVRSRSHELRIGKGGSGCGSVRPTIGGTPGTDRLIGTAKRDVIFGYGGADRIRGGRGNDLICAGAGKDSVRGGRGRDVLAGLGGKDLLIGGRGRDTMIGGRGKDRLRP